jgi:hypothetical protein
MQKIASPRTLAISILKLKGAAHFMSNTLVCIAWLQSFTASGGVDAPSRSAPVDL